MRDDLPRLLAPPALPNGVPNPAHIEQGRLSDAGAGGGDRRGGGATRSRERGCGSRSPTAASFAPRAGRGPRSAAASSAARGSRPRPSPKLPRRASRRGGRARRSRAAAATAARSSTGRAKPMRPDVAAAFDRMAAAARAAGVSLVVNSAFRSDAEQAALFAAHPDPTLGGAAGPLAAPLRDRARPRAGIRLRLAGGQRVPLRLRPALLVGGLALRLHGRPGALLAGRRPRRRAGGGDGGPRRRAPGCRPSSRRASARRCCAPPRAGTSPRRCSPRS